MCICIYIDTCVYMYIYTPYGGLKGATMSKVGSMYIPYNYMEPLGLGSAQEFSLSRVPHNISPDDA